MFNSGKQQWYMIIIDRDETKRLELTDEWIRNKVKAVSTREHLRQLFDLV
jgi:hypothetical protein